MFEELQHCLRTFAYYSPHPSAWVVFFIAVATVIVVSYLVDQKPDLSDPVEPEEPETPSVKRPESSNTAPTSD